MKIRWGIVGPGKIAKKFTADLLLLEDAEVTAVASRNLDRAKEFAKEFEIPIWFGSYEELFTSDKVDIVYIATPHRFHKIVTHICSLKFYPFRPCKTENMSYAKNRWG